MSSLYRIVYDTLADRPIRTVIQLHRELKSWFADRFVLATEADEFCLETFCRRGYAIAFPAVDFQCVGDLTLGYDGSERTVHEQWTLALFDVRWSGLDLRVLTVQLDEYTRRSYIIADTFPAAERFFRAVCDVTTSDPNSIVCFHGMRRDTSPDLRNEIAKCRLEDMVLAPTVREALDRDVIQFFHSQEAYERFNIPWKRGVLLLGPPGNGKTHAIKGVINHLSARTVYVRSFADEDYDSSMSIRRIFRAARAMAPCVMVFEDLDTMVDEECRSVFLNELDGFSSNHGLLILATANDPTKLDPALSHRPSRFDRKITFTPPSDVQRKLLLEAMVAKWDEAMRVDPDTVERVAQLTEGFSFATLKELGTGSMLAWFNSEPKRPMDELLVEMATHLKKEFEPGRSVSSEAGDPPKKKSRRWRVGSL